MYISSTCLLYSEKLTLYPIRESKYSLSLSIDFPKPFKNLPISLSVELFFIIFIAPDKGLSVPSPDIKPFVSIAISDIESEFDK